MFEGFVSQILLGYLGRYVKGIQKDQLKIGLWREEVLLENVELILEAFDYMQLPFALRTGKVGKLSIKVPWKKLGWEPIIVALEDVFICASQREDNEWSSDSVERRELAGKMAKLNAVELAKFSRRVSDNPAGQSFLSYIYAKILDSIQVSIRNIHIMYIDSDNYPESFTFGLRLSTLTVMTDTQKQSATMSTAGKLRSAQVNKTVEVSNIGLYSNLFEGKPNSFGGGGTNGAALYCDVSLDPERYEYIVNPFDVSISLTVNKSGKVEGAPQYVIAAELTALVLSLNEIQLENILTIWDYFSISGLREKYGRYRPSQSSLTRKVDGWQRIWWRYALDSVLSDVRRKLRKTFLCNLPKRISQLRRYVKLYKRKLELLQQELLVGKDILLELEKMDKEFDIDDILNFRSVAELELQELMDSKSPIIETNDLIHAQGKQQISDQSARRERGWLNWLSLGMLGAGGTADSSSFAGVVSDEIIKDIYDATEFHPVPSQSGDSSIRDKFCSFNINLIIGQITCTISSGGQKRSIANAVFDGINLEYKVWEGSVSIRSLIDSVKIINPSDDKILLLAKKAVFEESSSKHMIPFIDIQVNMLQPNLNSEVSAKVIFQPFEAIYESDFCWDLISFCDILMSFKFQHDRVLTSLNGFTSFRARLLSKTECVSSNRKKINWDITLQAVIITLPLRSVVLGDSIMTLEMGNLSFKSRPWMENCREFYDYIYEACLKDSTECLPKNFQLQELYDHYSVELTGCEVYMSTCNGSGKTSIIENFSASLGLQLCIFFDEPILKALEVDCLLPSIGMHLSPAIFSALVGARDKIFRRQSNASSGSVLDETEIIMCDNFHTFQYSLSVKSDHVSMRIDLEVDALKSSVISLTSRDVVFRYAVQEHMEIYFYMKVFKAEELSVDGLSDSYVLCSSRSDSGSFSSNARIEQTDPGSSVATCNLNSSDGCCLKLNYHALPDRCIVQHECGVCLNGIDLHVYPRIFGMLQKFFHRLEESVNSGTSEATETVGVEFSEFDFSKNPTTFADTPSDHFPFVNMYNLSSFGSLESSSISGVPELQSSHIYRKCPGLPKFRKQSRTPDFAVGESPLSTDTVGVPTCTKSFDIFLTDINLNNFRVHFHDSSCILGTVTLPKSRSFVLFEGSDHWDAQISTEGLILSTSWSPPNIHEQLWFPASSSISPMLSVHLKKRRQKASPPSTEISIGVQHVCCILPSTYLAMVIGYFSLPDWNQGENNQSKTEEFIEDRSQNSYILYKFEILDSILILPVERPPNFWLQLGLPKLYISFIPMCSRRDLDGSIPSCCEIQGDQISENINVINMFGRNLSLSFLPLSEDANFLLKQDVSSTTSNIPLIEQLDADLWIRIPCKIMTCFGQYSAPTLMMSKVDVCKLIIGDECIVDRVQAISGLVDKLSSVGKDSERFNSVLQFLQFSRSLNEADEVIMLDPPNDTFVSMKVCVQAISIEFSRSVTKVVKADTQFKLVASLEKGKLQLMDVNIPSMVLNSSENNLPLASFLSDNSVDSYLCINFIQSEQGERHLLLSIPFLDFWLHLVEWNNFVDLLLSYSRNSETTSCSSGASADSICDNVQISQISPCFTSDQVVEEDVTLIVESKTSTIAIHLPICDKEENLVDSDGDDGSQLWKYIKFTLQSRYCEFIVGKSYVKLKYNLDKVRAMLEVIHGQNVSSIPFIQISQVKLESQVLKQLGELMHILVDVQIESLDMGFSYQIFRFWSRSKLKLPEKSSSPLMYHCMIYNVHLRKGSLLLSDGRWSYHGPIFETLTKNVQMQFKQTTDLLQGLANADIVINYNNIDKVMWEPFVEPCSFQLNLSRKFAGTFLLNKFAITDIHLESREHLNLNITEPLIEAIFRVKCMIEDALNQSEAAGIKQIRGIFGFQSNTDVHSRRYAPYILQNDTSLPLTFYVSRGPVGTDDNYHLSMNHGNIVQPGQAVPIYVDETVDEQFLRHRTSHSSERLIDRKVAAVSHHMISIHLDGTSGPSTPMSMDLVGLSCFEVNFSNNKQLDAFEVERVDDVSGFSRTERKSEGLVVPVVFEVSMQHFSKILRLYSTVILFNSTSVPLEMRFDIPFGLSPKVLDPIIPGQELPLPLHLAEAGRIRWRPVGNNYLWSEAHSLSNILSHEYRLGFMRSFVCYPSHPSSDPFRCCLSIQDYSLFPSGRTRKRSSFDSHRIRGETVDGINHSGLQKKHVIRQVRMSTPMLVKNFLPIGLSLMIESGGSGVAHSISVKEVDSASLYHVDSTNDLGITFHMQGFRPVTAKFTRAEAFSSEAKLNGLKYYLSETLSLYSETSSDPTYVTLEKSMDAFSGAREICLYVSFLLYNCTGFVLAIVDGNHERKGSAQVIPSSYHLIGHEHLLSGKQGLPVLSSELESLNQVYNNHHTVSTRENTSLYSHMLSTRNLSSTFPCGYSGNDEDGTDHSQIGSGEEVKPYMYSPLDHVPPSELTVKLCAYMPQSTSVNSLYPTWSSPFPLLPASGSANIVIPKPGGSGAFLISATSTPVSAELSGRTRTITFQPRYVICNACSKDLCYKQRGTNSFYRLGVDQHAHLHWSDTTRELHVSIRFNEPGWQWSGSFLPDCLGDVQVKMRNYVSGTFHMVRVEVQNADLAISGGKKNGKSNLNSSTQLILLSDDKSGFMPYRIDNFSMERLRAYQQKCESFETVVHAYTSNPFAWDEPCYPHRLVVEVPGERILGTYALDNVKKYMPVCLPSTSEKAERRLYVSVHAEGAIKVLSIIDSTFHIVEDMNETNSLGSLEKKKADRKQGGNSDFSEVITFRLPFIGISLINSFPQELVFACAREATITLMQNSDQQEISFQILELQIDNQISDTPYPIILSFDNENKGRSMNFLRNKDQNLRTLNENACASGREHTTEYVTYFSAAKWRNVDASLVSFKYIIFRLAPLCIELEEQVLLNLLAFFRTVSLRLQNMNLQKNIETLSMDYSIGVSRQFSSESQDHKHGQYNIVRGSKVAVNNKATEMLPAVFPIGNPWQQIYLSARRQKKLYVEAFELAPIKLSLSFTSTPWLTRNEVPAGVRNLAQISSTTFQRGLMALVDIEGMRVHLGELILGHLMASHESIEDIVIKHYTRQLLHEIYKVFGSAGVIGNPIGFARNVGLGIKDFLSVSSREVVQSPAGLLNGIAKGSKSLLSNTVYAVSSATSQFTKTAHKGIVAFTFEERAAAETGVQIKGFESHGKGILNEFLEGLTGLLQSPIKGAEKHGLPGVFSGIAMGTAGLVARPMASILEATGKTAQSIRKRSSPNQSKRFRARFPRPLARELPLLPYSWEEAIGVTILMQADGSRLKDETFITCKSLKQPGKFLIVTGRLVLAVWCSCLVDLHSTDFAGVAADPEWVIETEMSLESIVHIDRTDDAVNIVGSNAESLARQKKSSSRDSRYRTTPISSPLSYMRLEMPNSEGAEDVLQVLVSAIEEGKKERWGTHVLHRSNLR